MKRIRKLKEREEHDRRNRYLQLMHHEESKSELVRQIKEDIHHYHQEDDIFSMEEEDEISSEGNTMVSLHQKDNPFVISEIIKKESMFKDFDLTSTGIANYIKYLKGTDFIWKNGDLYCFNGKFWEKDDTIMRIYIGGELYNFLKSVLITCFWESEIKL